jgi:type III restriction enzyme
LRARKDRSLCIPYQAQGRCSGFYPDFLIVRKADKGLLIDIAEPHDIRHEDSWSKVKGLAEYDAKHGHLSGRIFFAIFDKEARFKTLNLNDLDTQNRMSRLSSAAELQNVFQMIDS